MPSTFTLEQAKLHLEDLLAGADRGEEWLIVGADGKPVATLAARSPGVVRSIEPNREHASLIGLWEGKIELRPGWDDPLDEFEPYT